MTDLHDIITRFPDCRVGVLGDFIADRYIMGRPMRLSREAPIPILRHETTDVVLGGAANTVANVKALGGEVTPLGIVGDDSMGRSVRDLLTAAAVDAAGLITCKASHTVTKTRILAGDLHTVKQQIARIDSDDRFVPSSAARERLAAAVEAAASTLDVLVISDYGYRTIDRALTRTVLAKAQDLPILVDSHDRIREFPGVMGAMPNESEAGALSGVPLGTDDDVRRAGAALREELGLGFLLVTRGNRGMMLFMKDCDPQVIEIAGSDDITDVSGAGDTVTALMALGVAAGSTPFQAAALANFGAGVVVMKRGTATLGSEELAEAIGPLEESP